jgi:hypothetical protein
VAIELAQASLVSTITLLLLCCDEGHKPSSVQSVGLRWPSCVANELAQASLVRKVTLLLLLLCCLLDVLVCG